MNKQIKISYYSLLLIVIASCSEVKKDEVINSALNQHTLSTVIKNIQPVKAIKDSVFNQNLTQFFDAPINLSELKKEIHFLHMGTCLSSNYLQPLEKGYSLYNYGVNGGSLKSAIRTNNAYKFHLSPSTFSNSRILMSISTYKPSIKKDDNYYSNNNEIVIGIENIMNYDGLNPYNFVDKDTSEIMGLFGVEYKFQYGCMIYLNPEKVLVLKIENNKVAWYKYYWINEKIETIDALPESLFTWTQHL